MRVHTCVPSLHGLSLYLRSGQTLTLSGSHRREIRAVNTLAVATRMRFAGLQLVDICVGGLAEGTAFAVQYGRAEKNGFLWGFEAQTLSSPPLPSTLSGVLLGQGISLH